MNQAQNKIFHKLLSQLGQNDPESKASIVLGATKGRTDSSRQMTWYEADACIKFLRGQFDDRADKMRKKVIACLRSYGMVTRTPEGHLRADMPRINEWVLKYGYAKKPLNNYSLKELPKLVSQAEQLTTHE